MAGSGLEWRRAPQRVGRDAVDRLGAAGGVAPQVERADALVEQYRAVDTHGGNADDFVVEGIRAGGLAVPDDGVGGEDGLRPVPRGLWPRLQLQAEGACGTSSSGGAATATTVRCLPSWRRSTSIGCSVQRRHAPPASGSMSCPVVLEQVERAGPSVLGRESGDAAAVAGGAAPHGCRRSAWSWR